MTPEQEQELAKLIQDAAKAVCQMTKAIAEWWEAAGPELREKLKEIEGWDETED